MRRVAMTLQNHIHIYQPENLTNISQIDDVRSCICFYIYIGVVA